MVAAREQVERMLRQNLVLDLEALRGRTKGRSRMSLFRDLKQLGYLTSYTHAGRHYTLREIPTFDAFGLWMFRGIGFSRAGSLKATVVELVERSEAGYMHGELASLLRVRVHNTLLQLTRAGQIRRESSRRNYVYVSAEPSRAAEQMETRVRSRAGSRCGDSASGRETPSTETIIAVLVEALHIGDVQVEPSVVTKRLTVRGVVVSVEEVEGILTQYGLGKKTAPAGSRRSRW